MATDTTNFILSGLDAPEAEVSAKPMLDLTFGNHGGYNPHIGGFDVNGNNFEEILASSAYVKQPLIPVLLAFPEYMNKLPENSMSIKYMFKALVEKAYNSFGGFNGKISVITEEHQIGSSQEMYEEVMDVQRARSQISYNFTERAGKPIQRILNHLIFNAMMHPDTKAPLIRNYLSQEDINSLYLPNMYRFCAIYIEPDRTFFNCVDAFLVVNAFFKDSGDRDGGRDLKNRTKLVEYDIELASITMNDDNTIELGQKILSSMSIHSMTPRDVMAMPITGKDADVEQVNSGYEDGYRSDASV